jgi:hypothetical protein
MDVNLDKVENLQNENAYDIDKLTLGWNLTADQNKIIAEASQISFDVKKTVDSHLNGKEFTSAVQTRAQVRAEARKVKPLKYNV